MLLRYQPGANSSSQMFIQESCDFNRVDIFSALQKSASQSRYCVRVCLDQVCEDLCESYLVFEGRNGLRIVWQQCRQRVKVIVINLRDIRVRDNNEWKVSKSLYSMCEPNWEEREGKVGGGKQRVGREWRSSVPWETAVSKM